MSSWTYINGIITVSPMGRTQHEKTYILNTVLDHLPRVPGEGRQNVSNAKKNAERLLRKLERYEQEAYDGEFGSDWLEDIGEGFKFYVEECVAENKPVTIKGFERHIDAMRNGKAVAGYKH